MTSTGSECLDDDRICAIVDGTAGELERSTALAHVESCARCRDLIGVLFRSAASRPGALQPGTWIGDYKIVRVVGVGGMSIVYEAHDRELDRRVAVKVQHSVMGSEQDERRMLAESRAIAQLDHPNVVAVHHIDRWQGNLYMVMAFVDGETLTAWLAAAPRPWREIVRVFHQAGRGLAAAHATGVIHRDFKPDNVLVHRDGRVQVSDFGLAVRNAESDAATAGAGTPAYVAPEVLRGDKLDVRADQFSFAVALYESLWGQHPFQFRSRSELFDAVQTGAWREPPTRPRVPRRIRGEILRALDPDPNRRAPSLEPLLAALARPQSGRRKWLAVGASVGVASAAVAMLLAWQASGPATPMSCSEEVAHRIETVWHPARKTAIRSALAADASPATARRWQVVEVALDRYAAGWSSNALAACAASRQVDGPSGRPAPRGECLDDRLLQLDTTVALLATPDTVVASHAIEATQNLDSLDSCTGSATTPMESRRRDRGPQVMAVAVVRRARAKSAVLAHAGRIREAAALLEPVEQQARRLAPHPVVAEVQLLLGDILLTVEGPTAAAEMLRKAALSAEAAHHDEVAARAWIMLMAVTAQFLHDPALARDCGEHANAAIERLGRPGALEGHYLLGRGLAAWELESDARQALELYDQAERIWQAASPRDVVRALVAKARVYQLTGQPERAVELERANLNLRIERLGRDHPELAADYMGLGVALMFIRRFDEAIANGERGASLSEIASGPASDDLAAAIKNLGEIYAQAAYEYPEHRADAEHAYRRAHDMALALHGVDDRLTIESNIALAGVLRESKQLEQAAAIFASEVPHLERAKMGEELIAATRTNYALVLNDLGRFRESHELASSAVLYYERIAEAKPTMQLGLSLVNLASSEDGLGRRRDAIATGARAITMLRAVDANPALIKQLEADLTTWRRKLPVPAPGSTGRFSSGRRGR